MFSRNPRGSEFKSTRPRPGIPTTSGGSGAAAVPLSDSLLASLTWPEASPATTCAEAHGDRTTATAKKAIAMLPTQNARAIFIAAPFH